jgi:hypothetical protein
MMIKTQPLAIALVVLSVGRTDHMKTITLFTCLYIPALSSAADAISSLFVMFLTSETGTCRMV